MPRQYTQRTPEEKYGIVQDYFFSGLPLIKYARTHNTPVKIMGHASHKVNPKAISKREAINLEISKKRTRKVALALAGMGVDPKMMSANAYSDYRPAEVEVDARSEALNRRVEIYMEY